MRILRALGALLPLALAAAFLLLAPIPSVAQEPAVALTLKAQTPFTTLEKPEVTITSVPGTSVRNRSVISGRVHHRSGDQIAGWSTSPRWWTGPVGTLITCDTFAQEGELKPGETREFTVSVDLSEIDGVSDVDSLVYPARVDLRSAGTQVAALDTPLVHLVREPEVPIGLAWWAEFDAPIAFDPQGRLADPRVRGRDRARRRARAAGRHPLRRRRIDRRRRVSGARRRADGDRPAGPDGRRVRTAHRARSCDPTSRPPRTPRRYWPASPTSSATRACSSSTTPFAGTAAPVARIGWARARPRPTTGAGRGDRR